MSKLTVSKDINNALGYTIIPLLLTILDSESLFKYVSRYIHIPESYKMLIDQIENNMKHNNLTMANFTIENKTVSGSGSGSRSRSRTKNSIIKNKHKSKVSKSLKRLKLSKQSSTTIKASHTKASKIHQLFIISINNRAYTKSKYDELLEIARITGNTIFNTLKTNQIKNINIIDTLDGNYDSSSSSLQSLTNSVSGNTKIIEALIEGLYLSSYKFLKYKTEKSLTKEKDKFALSNINVVLPHYWNKIHYPVIHSRIIKLQNQIKSVFLARDLVNEPANKAKSEEFIDIVKKTIKDNKLPITLELFDKKELEKMGMGLVLGVGSGSSNSNEPKVLIIKYDGNRSRSESGSRSGSGTKSKRSPEYVLLGKGITFDTGGLDIKGTRSMIEMKTDMSGAATVSSFLLGYAMNKGSKCIYTICPFAENSVGPNSTKPSDVIKAYNGTTVEISNTDAEGRLILADCLAYTVDKYPNATIIDFATLTGQQESLSCKLFSNILSVNSKDEVHKLIASGKKINELLVELPIMEKQLKHLESYVADIKNVSFSCSADIIMSSLFMRQFVKKNTKWMHIDIAGPSYKANEAIKYASPEASGVGVRLLFAYFD